MAVSAEEARKCAAEHLRQRRGEEEEEDPALTELLPMAVLNEEEGDSEVEVDTRGDEQTLIEEPEIDEEGVARDYEVVLKHLGLGWFHVLLMIINGLAISSDAIEVLSIGFVLPVLRHPDEFAMEDWMASLLSSVIFVGMLFGSYIWGSVADVVGRRPTLVCSLTVSGLFGLASAFAPNYGVFIALRFASGFGVSGSLPVIAPYMAEFIRNKYRGPVLGISSTFWMVGRLLCGAFAWIIIPMGLVAPFNFHSWRLFIAISALPSLLGAAAYFLLPESPRFLLEVGKEKEALKALRLAYRINNLCRRGARFPIKGVASEAGEEAAGDKMPGGTRCQKLLAKALLVLRRTREVFSRKLLRRTLLLSLILFCLSFGSYGVALWYPSYVDIVTTNQEEARREAFCQQEVTASTQDYPLQEFCGCQGTEFSGAVFRDEAVKNWTISNATFTNTQFTGVNMSEAVFLNSTFVNVSFHNVLVERSFVLHCSWSEVSASGTLLQASQLCGLELINSDLSELSLANVTVNSVLVGLYQQTNTSLLEELLDSPSNQSCDERDLPPVVCREPDSFKVYRDSFFVSASALPGNIASAIAVYYLTRKYWLSFSLLASTVAVILLFFVHSEVFVVVMLCLFTALSTPAWNDSTLIIAEVYPTHLRTTANGIHLLMARIGAIIGTNIFGEFININPSVPILFVAFVLCVGGIAALPLPKTTRKTQLK